MDQEMILRAIKSAQIDYLYCVFCYNENWMELDPDDSDSDANSETDSDQSFDEGDHNDHES
jgi:hypothetical protein